MMQSQVLQGLPLGVISDVFMIILIAFSGQVKQLMGNKKRVGKFAVLILSLPVIVSVIPGI
jgi:hypothetical protein